MTTQQPGDAEPQARTRAHRSDAGLRLLATQLPALIWTADASLRITSVVGAEQVRPERPPDWYIGKTLPDILGPEASELPIIPAHQSALRGTASRYERRAADRVFDVRVQPLRDQGQQIVGCLGLAIDITERTRSEQRLATQYAVSRTLAEATCLEGAAPGLLRAIAECLGWECGTLWVLDHRDDTLVCQELWHAEGLAVHDFAALTQNTRCQVGAGHLGRIWQTGEPIWLATLEPDPAFPRIAAAAAAGLRASFGLPILLNHQVVGVIEFFSSQPHEPDAAVLEFVASLGQQIGQFIERTRAEAERTAVERELLAQHLEAERLADREQLRRELLGSVSHDLRTPLTSARAALGLLDTTGGVAPGSQQLLDNARRSLERLRLLIDDLVAANELLVEGAAAPLAPVQLDLRDVAEAAAAPLVALMERKGQQLVRELPAALPVGGDSARLEQVVSNLLANAHYHTGPGTRITLAGWSEASSVHLVVHDDGPGITAEVAASLFRPLYRIGAEAVGSGLGLAVARSIVERHGGRLWYELAAERGVVFHLALPAAR